jgi:hypothetical protein
MLSKALPVKAASVAAVLIFGVGTAAAATGGPGAAQSTAKHVLANLGITVPGPNSHSGTHADTRGKSAGHAATDHSTGANSNADYGLCTAEEAHADAGVTPNTNATVWPSATTCTTVTKPGKGSDQGGAGTANKPASTPDGPPSSTPAPDTVPVTTPNMGSASNGANSTGATASNSGAGNSTDRGRP